MAKKQAKPQVEEAFVAEAEAPVLQYWGKGNALPEKKVVTEIDIKAAFYRRLHTLALSQEQDVKNAFDAACREVGY